ncbi:hypothetical protein X801_01245, partial [Opisthorchis viverrini]
GRASGLTILDVLDRLSKPRPYQTVSNSLLFCVDFEWITLIERLHHLFRTTRNVLPAATSDLPIHVNSRKHTTS